MKALSVWQPWASLIADGLKRMETRPWQPGHRGPILICAAKKRMSETEILDAFFFATAWKVSPHVAGYFYDFMDENANRPLHPGWSNLPFGMALCVANLVWVGPTEKVVPIITEHERGLGNFSKGRFAWDLRDVRRFVEPWPLRGQQGLFDVPDDIVAQHALERQAGKPAPQERSPK